MFFRNRRKQLGFRKKEKENRSLNLFSIIKRELIGHRLAKFKLHGAPFGFEDKYFQ